MKILSIISVLIFSVISTESYGIFASIRPTLNGHTDEDCSSRSQNGGLSNLSEITQGLEHKAGWFRGRDNSLIDANNELSEAMGFVYSSQGESQAVQVCEGVYLASAHGVLSDPREGPQKDPTETFYGIASYPIGEKNYALASNNNQFVSPRLGNTEAWNDKSTDYVFIKVDEVLTNEYVVPLDVSVSDVVESSKSGDMDVHLYRGKSRFARDSNGEPNFDEKGYSNSDEFNSIYDSTQRVRERCSLVNKGSGIIGHDCPTEGSVSGSPLVTNIQGENYLTGIHRWGTKNTLEQRHLEEYSNEAVSSSNFCNDYEKVCGQPCASSDILKPGISL